MIIYSSKFMTSSTPIAKHLRFAVSEYIGHRGFFKSQTPLHPVDPRWRHCSDPDQITEVRSGGGGRQGT